MCAKPLAPVRPRTPPPFNRLKSQGSRSNKPTDPPRNPRRRRVRQMAAINELLPDDFIAAYTKFSSMQQWSLAWEEESGRPFNRLPALDQPHSRLDRFVNINTVFSGWREMYHYAFECWVARAAEKQINVSTFRPRPMPRFVDSPKSQTLDLNQSSNVDRIFGAVMIIGAIPEALTGAALIA